MEAAQADQIISRVNLMAGELAVKPLWLISKPGDNRLVRKLFSDEFAPYQMNPIDSLDGFFRC